MAIPQSARHHRGTRHSDELNRESAMSRVVHDLAVSPENRVFVEVDSVLSRELAVIHAHAVARAKLLDVHFVVSFLGDSERRGKNGRRRSISFAPSLRAVGSFRRFTRLSLGFSKTLEHLTAAVHLYMAFFNFRRVRQTLHVTPAMQARITDHVWTIKELITQEDV
jgi:hypothetical protein